MHSIRALPRFPIGFASSSRGTSAGIMDRRAGPSNAIAPALRTATA